MKWAIVFTGQGSQKVGMGKDIYEAQVSIRNFFEKAHERLGYDLKKLCFEGPESELTLTQNAQPAILTVSIALWSLFQERWTQPIAFTAGHSLGEYTALVASNVLRFEDAVLLVHKRGVWMQEAVPQGVGAMFAVLGLPDETVKEVCESISQPNALVVPANFNAPGQVVIAGHKPAVQTAGQKLKELGGKIIPLKVSAPFHTPLMKPAEDKMAKLLDTVEWNDPVIPWISNVTAEFVISGQKARDLMKKQITSPVLWSRIVKKMKEEGVTHIIEIGPGKVLTGLIRRIDSSIKTFAITSLQSFHNFFENL